MSKLKILKGKLKEWNKAVFGHVGQMKEVTIKAIESLDKDEAEGTWGSSKIAARKDRKKRA